MAALRRDKAGWYSLLWTDRRRQPAQKREALKTMKKPEALQLKARLEHEYLQGIHDPWRASWYERNRAAYEGEDENGLLALVEQYKTAKYHMWSQRTRDTVKWRLQSLVQWFGPRARPEVFTERDVQAFLNRLPSEHTRHSNGSTVRAFFNWVRSTRGIAAPVFKVRSPSVNLPKFIPLEIVDRAAAWHEANTYPSGRWYADVWRWQVRTGMRIGETMRLQNRDIQLTAVLVGGSFRTKTGRQRMVPILDAEIIRIIEKYRGAPDALLFPAGSASTAMRINQDFRTALKAVAPDLDRRTIHDLRHTFAVNYLKDRSGGDATDFRLLKLMKILGHTDIKTTQRYLECLPELLLGKGVNFEVADDLLTSVGLEKGAKR